jgi:hypothetical protein
VSVFRSAQYIKGWNEVMDAIKGSSGVKLWGELLRVAIRDKLGNDYYLGQFDALQHYENTGRAAKK